ncbi:MAG: beta-ketoacyl-ACP synthase II [Gemmatimonadales bacterium]
MPNRRVAITGVGPVTPIGIGVESFWQGLRSARSAVRRVTRFDPSPFRSQAAAEVDGFEPTDWVDPKRAKRLDRCSLFSLGAAQLALADAGIELEREDPDRVGAMMGTALGGVAYAEQEHGKYLSGGLRAVEPGLALTVFVGASSCNLAIELGISGPNITNGMSCASGAIAIGEAGRTIGRGEADLMLAGGAEAPLSPLTYGAFAIIRAMSTRNDDPATASRPFDRNRDGFVMAEGAAVLVLEEWERARARGAPIYAELIGYGLTNDAHHMTAPRPDGRQAARAMQHALAVAEVPPEAVEYVNAHGSSTPLNDPTEALAIRTVLGRHADRVRVSGTKGYYGHALGASGAIEAAICALASRRGWLPPSVNLHDPDPACELDYVRGNGEDAESEYLMSNSFGFGGINASLLFRTVR